MYRNRFASLARPGRDWIHPESLVSDEVWQALLDLASTNLQTETAQVL